MTRTEHKICDFIHRYYPEINASIFALFLGFLATLALMSIK